MFFDLHSKTSVLHVKKSSTELNIVSRREDTNLKRSEKNTNVKCEVIKVNLFKYRNQFFKKPTKTKKIEVVQLRKC